MRRSVVLALLAVVLAGACSVPTDAHARKLPTDEVPYGLLEPASTTTTTAPEGHTSITASIYFVLHDRLVALPRQIPVPGSASQRVAALLDGPSAGEGALGVRSAVRTPAIARPIAIRRGVATIGLGPATTALRGQEQILALAQIVYTATGDPSVHAVEFRIDGAVVPVPDGTGTTTTRPLQRSDYAAVAPART